jgi:hypothetical protein
LKIPKEIISEFEIKVKGVVDGFYSGKQRSRTFGSSPEFAGHRPYYEGDDIRRVDWKAFARRGRLFLKQFSNESEIPVIVLFDDTKSMGLFNKDERAQVVAGMVMFAANRLNYRFSLVKFSGEIIPPGKGVNHLLRCYYEAKGKGKGSFREAVYNIVSRFRKRSLVVLISDLEFDWDELQGGLSILLKFHDLVVFHILSGEEWNFQLEGKILVDAESGKRVQISPNSATFYRGVIRKWAEGIRNFVLQRNGRYSLIFSDTPIESEAKKVMETLGVI